jgi:branched-chain amino acid transport system substrate-binding protein
MRRRSVLASLPAVSLAAVSLPAVSLPSRARADDLPPLRIGVLGDPTGIGAFASGFPTELAARMAVQDFGPLPSGRPVQIITGEFRLKPDDALAIARRWFDDPTVGAIIDLPTAGAAEAVQDLARTRNRIILNTSSINPALTGRSCAPTASQWADDSIALGNAVARGLAADGVKTWYLIVPDTVVSLALQRDAQRAIEATGGRVVGMSQHPSGVSDLTSPVTEARRSGAQAIGLCGIGDDLTATLRQARAAGLFADGRKVAAFLVSITSVHAIGLATAQDLLLPDSFYWNENDPSRSFGNRFMTVAGRMPGKSHAATYAAILHYLRSVVSADTMDAATVSLEMRRTPVYFFGRTGRIRVDGRLVLDMTLYRTRSPAAAQNEWDCYEFARKIPATEAYRTAGQGGCALSP